MSCLITGGAGFIGYHLARTLASDLLEQDRQLFLVDNLQRGQQDDELQDLLELPHVTLIVGDLCDPQTYALLPQDITEIYHLAAMVGVKHCMQQPEKVLDTNLRSTQELIAWAKKLDFPRLLFASTSEIYAGGYGQEIVPVPTPEQIPICVEDLSNPRFSYAVSKMAGEMLVRFNAPEAYDFRIVRFHNIYGPRMGFAHVIPEVLRRIHAGECPFQAYGHDQTRAFCYIDDAVAQLQAVMAHPPEGDPLYHLGNAREEIQIGALLEKIFQLCRYEAPLIPVNAPEGSVQRRCPDTRRIETLWNGPWTTLDYGLEATLNWYRDVIAAGDFHE